MDNQEQYQALYQFAKDNPEQYWAEQAAEALDWFTPWSTVQTGDFNTLDIQWFLNGTLNACYNCVDRHLAKRGEQVALIWEGNDPKDRLSFTYQQLHTNICQLANALKAQGVKPGDRVCIYLPMIPEAVFSILACARIGAIHSVVFAGFSADALKTRILDADCQFVITANEGVRGEKIIDLKQQVDKACLACPNVKRVIVVKRTANDVAWQDNRDVWYHQIIHNMSSDCPALPMQATDPLFILYTSGSTGKPKGVLHSIGGYLVYVATTFKQVFQYQPGDVYWCTADIGWITGHSYLIYGPLANSATTLLFEGIPSYPSFSRYWDIIDQYKVNQFYTSPTALRALRREGDQWLKTSSRQSLKLLGSVGEPLNPDVWDWYYDIVGHQQCPIINTWWQTETGGILLTSLSAITPNQSGTVGYPLPGIVVDFVDEQGQTVPADKIGQLVIKQPWPGMMRTIYHDHERFVKQYFEEIPGCYWTSDVGYRDQQGLYWILGRNDDVIKVSGHRIGSEELESAFISHPTVAEAAVVSVPDEIKGEHIHAFISLKTQIQPSDTLKKTLIQYIREEIGPFAAPETVQWVNALPKTRSGKIMRRILRQIANHEFDNLGDTSTLADSSVLDEIIEGITTC